MKNPNNTPKPKSTKDKIVDLLAIAFSVGLGGCAHGTIADFNAEQAKWEKEQAEREACSNELSRLGYGYDEDVEPGPDFERCTQEDQDDFLATRERQMKSLRQRACWNEQSRLKNGRDDTIEIGTDFESCSDEEKAEILAKREKAKERREKEEKRDKCRAEKTRIREDDNAKPGEDFEACSEEDQTYFLEQQELIAGIDDLNRQADKCERSEVRRLKKQMEAGTTVHPDGSRTISIKTVNQKDTKACRKWDRMAVEHNRRVDAMLKRKEDENAENKKKLEARLKKVEITEDVSE